MRLFYTADYQKSLFVGYWTVRYYHGKKALFTCRVKTVAEAHKKFVGKANEIADKIGVAKDKMIEQMGVNCVII